jgi:hypothetical protein
MTFPGDITDPQVPFPTGSSQSTRPAVCLAAGGDVSSDFSNAPTDDGSGLDHTPSAQVTSSTLAPLVPRSCGASLSAELPESVRRLVRDRLVAMQIIAGARSVRAGAVEAARVFHGRRGFSAVRLGTLYGAWLKSGRDESVLVDRVRDGTAARHREALPEAFVQYWMGLCERHQRSSAAAYRALLNQWQRWRMGDAKAALPGYVRPPAAEESSRIPAGWSYGNLSRRAPSKFELLVSRQGRAAASGVLPLVYTSRKDLWVGSHYLFDDLWHDHMVNVLDTRKTGRPLEFHALDLKSACKFAWGMNVRTEREDGTSVGLTERAMRFLLAFVLGEFGFSPRGTVLVVEHGTAAIREDLERLLFDATAGKVKVSRSGMQGAAAHAGQYPGRSKGNFRFKAALESLGNLIHNEMADSLLIPGQTGLSVERRPEQLHGLLKHNDALLAAFAAMLEEKPELAQLIRFPLLEFRQFQALAVEVYDRINRRTHHHLEGWEQLCVPDTVTMRMRRLSPWEVWTVGRKQLHRLAPEQVALVLGPDIAEERRLGGTFWEIQDKEVSVDPLRFEGSPALRSGCTYATVLNPFQPDRLFCFDARGRLLATCPRIWTVSRADEEAVKRQMGRAAHLEKELLAPVAARGLAMARKRITDSRHNAAVLGRLGNEAAAMVELGESSIDQEAT